MPGIRLARVGKTAGIDRCRGLILLQPSFFKRFAELALYRLNDTWKAWLPALRDGAVPELGFDLALRALRAGERPGRPRSGSGPGMVNGYDAGRFYVEWNSWPAARARVGKIVASTREAFRQALRESDWLEPSTKREALDKLSKLTTKVGYPDRWHDYGGLVIKRDDLFGNTLRAMQFQNEYRMRRVAELTEPGEWLMTPQTVNAYYTAATNEIVLPAGILQPPLFQSEADDAVNYGAIGAVLGHEIGHAFDERGRTSDGSGRVRDWWTPADAARFASRTGLLVEQFNGFSPIAGMHVNGALTKPRTSAISPDSAAGLPISSAASRHIKRLHLAGLARGGGGRRSAKRPPDALQNQRAPSQYRANGLSAWLLRGLRREARRSALPGTRAAREDLVRRPTRASARRWDRPRPLAWLAEQTRVRRRS